MGMLFAITFCFILISCLCLFIPGFYVFTVIGIGIGIILLIVYWIVKKAVKDALREHEKEKARNNGPQ